MCSRTFVLSCYHSAIVVDLSYGALRDLAEALAVNDLAWPERRARRRCCPAAERRKQSQAEQELQDKPHREPPGVPLPEPPDAGVHRAAAAAAGAAEAALGLVGSGAVAGCAALQCGADCAL